MSQATTLSGSTPPSVLMKLTERKPVNDKQMLIIHTIMNVVLSPGVGAPGPLGYLNHSHIESLLESRRMCCSDITPITRVVTRLGWVLILSAISIFQKSNPSSAPFHFLCLIHKKALELYLCARPTQPKVKV